MMKELFGFLKEMLNRLFSSRLFALSIIFFLLFSVLTLHLFRLQILHGNDYLQEYQKNTKQDLVIPGTRGNIYDKDGKLLAYNELQYNITIAETGSFSGTSAGINKRNLMLKKLCMDMITLI